MIRGTPTFSLYYELWELISFLRFWDKFLDKMAPLLGLKTVV
ncbi:hypothetical protein LEP1GSC191_0266 [Leptospira borgpetersenii serovar Mini str. 201000851]|uniref:Uncharacterized protein n=2 Tax=Leptospira borgpetersenii TaxID=174 RepID=M3HMD0_LEPBO|nr:hypothetical protein LEP1GSC128_0619 [Leptospira borgpetersenii str. 200801926]EMF98824.1 hypothetical protein LEP1GSC123_2998 [Leptospira borgpetersenii str. 200701203]ENO63781.1 hypothetical protein LEP1GSC191_0266 [Leptospira borgpetersenii serovar Mini str. 201000851]